METYFHWQDIAFLPVVNSLVDEKLRKIESIIINSVDHNIYNNEMEREKDTAFDKIELWRGLCNSWKKWPNKTIRQIEWLNSLEYGIDRLKN